MNRPQARVVALIIGTLVFALIFALGTFWMRHVCMPWEVHIFRWECEIGLWFPTLAALLGGAVAGATARSFGFLLGFGVPLLGFALLLPTTLLHGWYGDDLMMAGQYALLRCFLPAAFAGWLSHIAINWRRHAL